MTPFQFKDFPLSPGRSLIEASAGTGKTYSIGLLVLRYLTEKLTPIDKILLVTFSKAATAELRDRTALMLRETIENWTHKEKTEALHFHLQDSLARVDEMPVFTIHGFFQGLLNEFSVEALSMPNLEVQENTNELVERVAWDFWRTKVATLPQGEINALPEKFGPEQLISGVRAFLNRPDAELAPYDDEALFESLKKEWKAKKEAYASINEAYCQEVEAFFEGIGKFPAYKTKLRLKRGTIDPYLEELHSSFGKENPVSKIRVQKIIYKLSEEIREKLNQEKQKNHVLTFDDMITGAYNAVTGASKNALVNAVSGRYDVVMVDEFQDTDFRQFEVFATLFADKPFIMIGDPKQAIYRFRGGDIYAYKKAKESVPQDRRFSMDKNFRSEKSLLQSIEALFTASTQNPFADESILFTHVEPGKDLEALQKQDPAYPPLVVWKTPNDEEALAATVQEIQRLIHLKVKPQDIAILVKSHALGKMYGDALREVQIPYALQKTQKLFASAEAEFLERLMFATQNPSKAGVVRACLVHPLFCSEQQITDDDLPAYAEKLAQALNDWQRQGVMRSLDRFFCAEKLWNFWMAQGIRGKRTITNMRHLLGILQTEERSLGKNPERLFRRFEELKNEGDNSEYEEGLDTDEEAVQIMTIHHSKGLQFPVVFVPSLRKGGSPEGAPCIYYDTEQKHMVAEYSGLGSAAAKAKTARESEKNQEAVRNFYVAVTRAERRLYLNFCPRRDKEGAITKLDPAEKIVFDALQAGALAESKLYAGPTGAATTTAHSTGTVSHYEKFDAQFPQSWSQKSFSSIDKSIHEYEGDGGKAVEERAFPPSPQAGTLLHSLFENLDFTLPQEQMNAKISEALQTVNGMTDARIAWAQELVWAVLHKELPGLGTSLSQVPHDSCRAELDFLMRMAAEENQVSTRAILRAMPQEIRFASKRDLDKEFYGFLNGQIDLFFESNGKTYVLDWKSNNLPKYGEEQLETSMKRHNYHLQYGVYCVAAKRYLERIGKNFDTDFGGVYYLFLRGIQKDTGNTDGIFYQPTTNLNWIHELDQLLNTEAAQ